MGVVVAGVESSVRCFLRTNQASAPCRLASLLLVNREDLPSGCWERHVVRCVTFDGCFSSASRFWRACSVGEEHGVALQIEQVAKGRPLRLMRINGRSGGVSKLIMIFQMFLHFIVGA